MGTLGRLWAGFKAFTMRWTARATWSSMFLGGTRLDWAREVGDGRGNAIVIACIRWVCRTFPEAPSRAMVLGRNGEWQADLQHALTQVLERPNPYYSGLHLWSATLADYMATGNAYWLKIRSSAGRVVQLWWVPSTMMEPRWSDTGAEFIGWYGYTVDGDERRVEVTDVVHFRDGFDPANIRKGLSPLASLARELATDNEAANWSASLLRNMGVPGVIIAPSDDAELTQEDANQVKTQFAQRFGGDRRGEPLVMSAKVAVSTLSFTPEQMVMTSLRRVPEERVTAIFGTPAVTVGLGAGLDHSIYNNMSEAREAAYESNIIPTQRLMAAELNLQLVPDFGDVSRLRVEFDLSEVRVLQDDEDKRVERVTKQLTSGMLTVNEARAEDGRDPIDGGDVLYVPNTVTPSEPGALIINVTPESASRAAGLRLMRRKAIEDLPSDFEDLFIEISRGLTPELTSFLRRQAARIAGRLVDLGQGDDDLVPDEEEIAALASILTPRHQQMLDAVHATVLSELGVSFDLPDPATEAFLRRSGDRITAITETTRQAVREAIIAGTEQGEGIDQIARRIRGLGEFQSWRAKMIARTELGQAQIDAAVSNYEISGVVLGVRVLDGDYDVECAARNNTILPLAQARSRPFLLHPNCTAAYAPIVDLAELREAVA